MMCKLWRWISKWFLGVIVHNDRTSVHTTCANAAKDLRRQAKTTEEASEFKRE